MYSKVKQFYLSLAYISDEDWNLLSERFTVKHIAKGEILHRPGEICNHVSFVNSGLLRSYMMVEGKEFISHFAMENCYISVYDSFLTRQRGDIFIDALEDTEVVQLSYENLQWLYRSVPSAQMFGRLIAEQIYILTTKRSNSLFLNSPEERYFELLRENPSVLQRVPQYMVASFIGVTPEALSRIRKRVNAR